MCQASRDQLAFSLDVSADDIAVLALSVVRFVASGYMTGDVTCWEAAHDVAERALGVTKGPVFVAALTGVMRAIRAESSGEWWFMPASCRRFTLVEERLVRLLIAARAGEAERTAEAGAAITGGPAPRLLAASRIAADLMEAHASFRLSGRSDPQHCPSGLS